MTALATARTYHDAWTGRDFETAAGLLADDLQVEVPINAYPDAASFAAALAGFGALATRVDLLSALGGDDEAVLLYDMEVQGLGDLRVAEHFTVRDGRIVRLRQIHDTAALREAAPDFRAEVLYDAPAESVFAAVADPGAWWCAGAPAVGDQGAELRLDWSATDFVVLRVDELEPPRAMRWTCVAQHDRNLPRADEWVGTSIAFRLAPEAGGTRLEVVHEGLTPQLECFEACDRGWDFFLRRSLRALVEAGEGLPYRP